MSSFDSVPHDLLMKAVAHHTQERWLLLYIERWLKAPMQMPDGTLVAGERGTPQGSPISPLLANLFMNYAFECATNVKRGDAVGSRLSMQCSTEDKGLMALRDRPMGDDSKPPHAALASDRRGERCGHGALDASGGDHGDDRCLTCREYRNDTRTGLVERIQDESGGRPCIGQAVSGIDLDLAVAPESRRLQ